METKPKKPFPATLALKYMRMFLRYPELLGMGHALRDVFEPVADENKLEAQESKS